MSDKVLEYGALGVSGLERGKFDIFPPQFILWVAGADSFEFNPTLKDESSDMYCMGMVLGYKVENSKPKIWSKVSTSGGDTEKKAYGILIASSYFSKIPLKSSSEFKEKPIGAWCILIKDAVVTAGLLRTKGEDFKQGDNPYEWSSNFKTDQKKRVAELENHCNIKVQLSSMIIPGVLDKPGNVT